LRSDWPERVGDVIGGGPATVLACAGPTLAGAARAARDGATIATPVPADYPDAAAQLAVVQRQAARQPPDPLGPWFDSGTLSVQVPRRYFWRNAAGAQRKVSEGHTRGKIVLIVDEDLAAPLEV
jgi:NADPH:quinone reductase-like Zn-dependent oxidoreductase